MCSKVESCGKTEAEHWTIKEMQTGNDLFQLKKSDVLQVKASDDVESYPQ